MTLLEKVLLIWGVVGVALAALPYSNTGQRIIVGSIGIILIIGFFFLVWNH